MKIIGIIPSRYNSVRLPGKPLINILGKSMIQRVYEQCLKSNKLSDILSTVLKLKPNFLA